MKNILFLTYMAAVLLCGSLLTSCDSVIYDEQGDCDPHHKVRFVYDYNLKFSDAFSHEVGEVTLYLVDSETGEVVWSRHDNSAAVSEPGYMMDVDIDPGKYTLVAWCGPGHRTHFTVNETGEAHRDALRCRLTHRDENRPADDPHHVSAALDHLYHGKLVDEVFTDEQGVHIHTVQLKKNTNDLHIVLQHVNGTPVKPDDFEYHIVDSNGHMDWDNSLLKDDVINYHPWWTGSALAGIEQPDGTITKPGEVTGSRAQTMASAAIADLRTSRLVKGQNATVRITRSSDGSEVLSLPLIDYALMVKGQHRAMDDQEYLDRQDDYSMVFFLHDKENKLVWLDTHIYVNSWKVVIQNTNL